MRTKKFDSLKFLRYEKHFLQSVQDPLPYALETADRARNAGVVEVDMSPSREVMLNSKAATLWKANEPCISAEEVVAALHITNSARWRYDNGIPKMLTAAQAAFTLDGWPDSAYDGDGRLQIQRTEIPTYGTINPRRPSLRPLDLAMSRTADTLVGAVAGRWRVLRHLTEADGYAKHKGVYKAACIVCGATEAITYTKAQRKPCKVCIARAPNDTNRHALRIKYPFTVWLTTSGDLILSEAVPENAVSRYNVTHRMLPTTPLPLTPKELECAQELTRARLLLEAKLQTTDLAGAEKQALQTLQEDIRNGTDLFGEVAVQGYKPKTGRPKGFRPNEVVKRLEEQQRREDAAADRARRKLLAEAKRASLQRRSKPLDILEQEAEQKLPIQPYDQEAAEERAVEEFKGLVDGLELPDF